MTLHFVNESVVVHHDDCLAVLRTLPDCSVDAVVTDPPYGLGFMGKAWDDLPPGLEWAEECLRVLKPGGHLLAFGGSRTWHRLVVAIEDAGFEVRDSIMWLYGSGFPKSMDVSKAIDKAAGAAREVVGAGRWAGRESASDLGIINDDAWKGGAARTETAPATPEAARWQGWGTALKPAFEPIVVARKPLTSTVAKNVAQHGTGALHIDACRVDMGDEYNPAALQRQTAPSAGMSGLGDSGFKADHEQATFNAKGRWPANVVLDESRAVELDEQSGTSQARIGKPRGAASGEGWGMTATGTEYSDKGGASRFFYVAKAKKSERPVVDGVAHPTVKPLALMRWLVRLVTPPGGTILEPFAGSGTTIEAAMIEGFDVIAIERDETYLPLIEARIARQRGVESVPSEATLFDGESA